MGVEDGCAGSKTRCGASRVARRAIEYVEAERAYLRATEFTRSRRAHDCAEPARIAIERAHDDLVAEPSRTRSDALIKLRLGAAMMPEMPDLLRVAIDELCGGALKK